MIHVHSGVLRYALSISTSHNAHTNTIMLIKAGKMYTPTYHMYLKTNLYNSWPLSPCCIHCYTRFLSSKCPMKIWSTGEQKIGNVDGYSLMDLEFVWWDLKLFVLNSRVSFKENIKHSLVWIISFDDLTKEWRHFFFLTASNFVNIVLI